MAVSKLPPLCILDEKDWPTLEEMNLDESQYKALQMALRNEFVIIQGPPGTGKTYLGLKIVEILLHNRDVWSKLMTEERVTNSLSPILIVCYTNHALDQFVEGISKFCKEGIVRIGGRSKSEDLEKYHLSKLKREMKVERNIPGEVYRRKGELREDINKTEITIHKSAAEIQVSYEGILHEELLKPHMENQNWQSLVKWTPPHLKINFGFYVVEWLGLSKQPKRGYRVGTSGYQNDTQGNEGEEKETKNTIKVAEEAREIQDERKVSSIFSETDSLGNYQKEAMKNVKLCLHSRVLRNEHMEFWMNYDRQKFGDQKCSRAQYLDAGLKSEEVMTDIEARQRRDLWRMNYTDRWKLYRHWVRKYRIAKKENIRESEKAYERLTKQMVEIRMEEDIAVMNNATVIAMTTSGAARYQNALQRISPRIVVVEEAAEVLEAHIVANLSNGCQHLILIGDHKQLRPNPTVYKLATRYNLEVSFFERMINNGIPYQCLQLQHRMRPEIAELISDIYPELQNHPCVEEYETVGGITKNLFFVDHKEMESTDEELMSKSNDHEAVFVVALCRYLMHQGFEGEDITILTLYTGQVLILKKLMPNDTFQGVKVCSVDNYQGEENKIIILSLVRSNDENKIGFLKIENRVCVALSRAKVGFYAIGNMELLANNSPLWKKLTTRMTESGNIGQGLELFCQNHPKDEHICAKNGADFSGAPNGGCMKVCESRLECGHACREYCHIVECTTFKCKASIRCDSFLKCSHTPDKVILCHEKHQYECMEPCEKSCPKEHPCPKVCHEDCGDCTKLVEKTIPKCNHSQLVSCHLDPALFKCMAKCEKELDCEHICPKLCHERCISRYDCIEMCHVELDCGHEADVPCYKKSSHKCKEMVEHIMPICGHSQRVECYKLEEHCYRSLIKCNAPCEKILKCGHSCKKLCYEKCESYSYNPYNPFLYRNNIGDCQERCLKKCDNDHRCKKKCHEPCGKCNETATVTLDCGHTKDVQCHVKTAFSSSEQKESVKNFIKCQKRCERKCEKGHTCKGKCCEECKPCTVYIVKEIPKCGHKQKMECRIDPSEISCKTQCKIRLQCTHEITVQCHQLSDTTGITCSKPCSIKLPCGHTCGGTCASCHQGHVHTPCKATCDRLLPCGHKCTKPCGCTDCRPCREKCRQRCEHRICNRSCSDPCVPCNARCGKSCQHRSCKNICSSKCGDPPCKLHCPIKFTCGKCRKKRPCLGVCGERCPKKCKICDRDEINSAWIGKKLTDGTRFILLEDCNHLIEVSYMDNHMAADDKGNTVIKARTCPKCDKPIVRSRRYRSAIIDLLHAANIEQEKKVLLGNEEFIKLRDDMAKTMKKLAIVDKQKHSSLEFRLKTSRNRNEVDADQLRAIMIQATVTISLAALKGHVNVNDEKTDNPNKKLLRECIEAYTNEILSVRRLVSSYELKQYKEEHRRLALLIKDNPEDILNSPSPSTVSKMMALAEKSLKTCPEGYHCGVLEELIIPNHDRQSEDVWMLCFKGHVWKTSNDVTDCPTCKADGTTFVKKAPRTNVDKASARVKMNDVDKHNKQTNVRNKEKTPPLGVPGPGEVVGIGARAKTHSAPHQGHHGHKDTHSQHHGYQPGKHPRQQGFQGQGHPQQSKSRAKEAWPDNNKCQVVNPDKRPVGDNKQLSENVKDKTVDGDKQLQQKPKAGGNPATSTGNSKKRQKRKKK
ncbi:unnamed protein product [Owenia fusiformis]|uniref:NF-X1-type domain-containing protein n=1 Tax=Owenia fusiformis TaxID=6347 RepID=A0A8S4PES6_OWEFU|nr:unnamed protein product [Owenia fusiformis]